MKTKELRQHWRPAVAWGCVFLVATFTGVLCLIFGFENIKNFLERISREIATDLGDSAYEKMPSDNGESVG